MPHDTPAAQTIESLLAKLEEYEWAERCTQAAMETNEILPMMEQIRDLFLERFTFARLGIMLASVTDQYCIVHELVTRDDMRPVSPGGLMRIVGTGLEWVFTNRRPHWAPDIVHAPEFREDPHLASAGVQSLMRLPLVYGGQVYGVMTIKSVEADAYAADQRALMARTARKLSAGIHSLKLILELRDLAMKDALTGTLNRLFLNELAAADNPIGFLRERGRYPFGATDSVGIVFIDVCRFKPFNDAHGHIQGDRRLVQVASLLTGAVGEDGVVVRFGGDEFVLLLPGATAAELAATVAALELAVQAFNLTELETAQADHPLDLSLGAACGAWSVLNEVVHQADLSMYQHKGVQRPGLYPAGA